MSDPKEPPKTKFQLLLEWASRDKICAMSMAMSGFAVMVVLAPKFGAFLLDALRIILSSSAVAAVLK